MALGFFGMPITQPLWRWRGENFLPASGAGRAASSQPGRLPSNGCRDEFEDQPALSVAVVGDRHTTLGSIHGKCSTEYTRSGVWSVVGQFIQQRHIGSRQHDGTALRGAAYRGRILSVHGEAGAVGGQAWRSRLSSDACRSRISSATSAGASRSRHQLSMGGTSHPSTPGPACRSDRRRLRQSLAR